MEARIVSAALLIAAIFSTGAGYRTQNFIVMCEDAEFAQKVCETAEIQRKELAIEWLGEELPPWPQPIPIRVKFEQYASGATRFAFVPGPNGKGQPINFDMEVSGSPERILDAVLPHEITHTIFATYFGQKLPRWADEGACTSVEHASEKRKHRIMLVEFLTTKRGIPFNRMFRMMEYPRDMLPLYAQGFSVADYLIQHHGKQHFVKYVERGLQTGNWDRATDEFYGYDDLSDLQLTWNDWVRNGSKPLSAREVVAQNEPSSTDLPARGRDIAKHEAESWYFHIKASYEAENQPAQSYRVPQRSRREGTVWR